MGNSNVIMGNGAFFPTAGQDEGEGHQADAAEQQLQEPLITTGRRSGSRRSRTSGRQNQDPRLLNRHQPVYSKGRPANKSRASSTTEGDGPALAAIQEGEAFENVLAAGGSDDEGGPPHGLFSELNQPAVFGLPSSLPPTASDEEHLDLGNASAETIMTEAPMSGEGITSLILESVLRSGVSDEGSAPSKAATLSAMTGTSAPSTASVNTLGQMAAGAAGGSRPGVSTQSTFGSFLTLKSQISSSKLVSDARQTAQPDNTWVPAQFGMHQPGTGDAGSGTNEISPRGTTLGEIAGITSSAGGARRESVTLGQLAGIAGAASPPGSNDQSGSKAMSRGGRTTAQPDSDPAWMPGQFGHREDHPSQGDTEAHWMFQNGQQRPSQNQQGGPANAADGDTEAHWMFQQGQRPSQADRQQGADPFYGATDAADADAHWMFQEGQQRPGQGGVAAGVPGDEDTEAHWMFLQQQAQMNAQYDHKAGAHMGMIAATRKKVNCWFEVLHQCGPFKVTRFSIVTVATSWAIGITIICILICGFLVERKSVKLSSTEVTTSSSTAATSTTVSTGTGSAQTSSLEERNWWWQPSSQNPRLRGRVRKSATAPAAAVTTSDGESELAEDDDQE
ncbi:unnamed protein product [Amoebophrya sp. A120]|nr:unnamed protein product [Amoebophrya sp. A120]|eukprot:GSA120T00018598001.1